MGPGATYAFVTFAVGVLCLLGWLYATAANPRSWAMLKKSLLLFLLPMMLVPGFAMSMWLLVTIEETLKAFASTREQKSYNKFWLVTLFGVWELMADKPICGLVLSRSGETWDRLSLIGLVYATTLPVLMHAVTAAVYAFAFRGQLWAAFAASWAIHLAFNVVVTYFYLSPVAVVIETATLGAILALLLRRKTWAPLPEHA